MSGHMEFARTTNILLVEQGFSTCCSWVQLAIRRVVQRRGPDGPTSRAAERRRAASFYCSSLVLMDTETRMESQPTRHSQLIKIKSGDEISLTSLRPPNALAFSKEKKLAQRGRQLQCKCKGPRGPWSGKNSISLITNGSQALGLLLYLVHLVYF